MIRLAAFSDEAGASLKEQIAGLKRNNLSLTEVRNVDGINVWDWSEDFTKSIRDGFGENGISVWSVGSPIAKVPVDTDMKEYLEGCKKIFKIANILNTDKIRVFSFFDAYDKGDKVIKNLKEIVKVASDYGVQLYHENEKEIYGDVVERVIQVLDGVEGLKSIFDPANYVQCNQNMAEAVRLLAHRTDYFHIKDVIAATGELVPAGEGDGMIRELLKGIQGDKTLTVEPHLQVFEGYEKVDALPMKCKHYFASFTESFDCAISSLKNLLKECGYVEDEKGDFHASKMDNR